VYLILILQANSQIAELTVSSEQLKLALTDAKKETAEAKVAAAETAQAQANQLQESLAKAL
jgi:hypothetical protein